MILNSLAFDYVRALALPTQDAALYVFEQWEHNPAFVKFAMGVFQIKLNYPKVWARILSQLPTG